MNTFLPELNEINMSQELVETFRRYTDVVRQRLVKFHQTSQTTRPLQLVKNAPLFRDEVERLEDKDDFRCLVEATYASFWNQNCWKGRRFWEHPVKTFFRRSGYYLDVAEGTCPSHDAIFDSYCRAFYRTKTQNRYLAPMEFVQFGKSHMDFKAFQIRRFAPDELTIIFQQRVNEVFYPHAAIDVNRLSAYWFIDKHKDGSPPLSPIRINWDRINRVNLTYTRYGSIKTVLQHLALFDWQADMWQRDDDGPERGWRGFDIPFVLRVDDNLLATPRRAPNLSRLRTEPWFDSQTGEEIGEAPEVWIHLNDDETNVFESTINVIDDRLTRAKGTHQEWEFLEVALDFCGKAFFAHGLEQLLWHITTLEALLGEKAKELRIDLHDGLLRLRDKASENGR